MHQAEAILPVMVAVAVASSGGVQAGGSEQAGSVVLVTFFVVCHMLTLL